MNLYKLKIYIGNSDIKEKYFEHANNHNYQVLTKFPNAGFDLLTPVDIVVPKYPSKVTFVPLDIKCEMIDTMNGTSNGFYMYPRSSISKTPLMLANHIGVIDSGYRGVVMGAFRNLDPESDFIIQANTRLLQITHPSLSPFIVQLVDESELSTTARGAGGFGSTGV
jgi:dUTP pyrophosphatase